jgi:hypothetical protein
MIERIVWMMAQSIERIVWMMADSIERIVWMVAQSIERIVWMMAESIVSPQSRPRLKMHWYSLLLDISEI